MIKLKLLALCSVTFLNCTLFMGVNPAEQYISQKMFEHCIYVDVTSNSVDEKLNCWINWTLHGHQTKNKSMIDYSHKRIEEILNGLK